VNPYQLPESKTEECLSPKTQSRFFERLFAVIGFLLGGGFVFYRGFCSFNPPPPPPGTAHCGNEILGGLFLMVIGSPLVAIICSYLAASVGIVLDIVLRHHKIND
jgi:hypothetical protein